MKTVYRLEHFHPIEGEPYPYEELFDLGAYESRARAETEWHTFYKHLPGFRDWPETNYRITPYVIDEEYLDHEAVPADTDTFYLLAHSYEADGCHLYSIITVIGYYSTKERAEEMKARYEAWPIFRIHTDPVFGGEWSISPCKLNRRGWPDRGGYTTSHFTVDTEEDCEKEGELPCNCLREIYRHDRLEPAEWTPAQKMEKSWGRTVYFLQYYEPYEDLDPLYEAAFSLGLFDHKETVRTVIKEFYSRLPGFCDGTVENYRAIPFIIDEGFPSERNAHENLQTVYLLIHGYETKDGYKITSWIGVYATRELVQTALARYQRWGIFKWHNQKEIGGEFTIDRMKINEKWWASGFNRS